MPIHVEEAWILDIKCFFENDDDDDLDKPPSIHNVPKTLKSIKPEAYTPQLIALGPYHHWREDLYEMERYKLITAKRVQSLFKTLKFQDLIDKLGGDVEPKIRACYHKYLTIDRETLAWMMAIDSLFLLQFLQSFVSRDESVIARSARMSFLVNSNERNLIGYDSILRDIIMLENQIPIFVLKKILKIQCPNRNLSLDLLPKMFLGICKEITPLKLKEDYPIHKIMKHRAHLLDLLYHLINPRCEQFQQDPIKEIEFKEGEDENNNKNKQGCLFVSHGTNQSSRVFHNLWNKVKSFGLLQKLKTGPLKGVINLAENLASQISPYIVKENPPSNGGSSSGDNEEKKALRVEEIMIPSVTHLVNSRVKFKPTNGDIYTIKFDKKTMTFYLPTIKLDVNSEVIIRNLVAYEASAISGPLVVARYTEFMNGIIDSAQDAKILVEQKIIESELSYEDVANMWNGMSKCVRLTRVDFMDKAIKDVNAYFYSMGKVKLYRMMKAYVYGSWRMLVILASLLVIGLMFLQSLCSVYDCPRLLHIGSAKNE